VVNQRGERGNRGEYRSQSLIENTNTTDMYARNRLSPVYRLCVLTGKIPLITFWSKFLGDDDSSIVVCISLNSLCIRIRGVHIIARALQEV
jgi:hypothetical protein